MKASPRYWVVSPNVRFNQRTYLKRSAPRAKSTLVWRLDNSSTFVSGAIGWQIYSLTASLQG
jgi:hypothetical protein